MRKEGVDEGWLNDRLCCDILCCCIIEFFFGIGVVLGFMLGKVS